MRRFTFSTPALPYSNAPTRERGRMPRLLFWTYVELLRGFVRNNSGIVAQIKLTIKGSATIGDLVAQSTF